jgi:hypothetical protein
MAAPPQPKLVFSKDRSFSTLAEFRLLSLRLRHAKWQERCRRWYMHIGTLVAIRQRGASSLPGGERIQLLFEHLAILDTKFSVLLTVNTLLLIIVNALLQFDRQSRYARVFAAAFGAAWLVIMILCLLGERRIVWGDLAKEVADPGDDLGRINETIAANDCVKAEEGHVQALIVEVARRTNKFRVAIWLTYWTVSLAILVFAAVIAAEWRGSH